MDKFFKSNSLIVFIKMLLLFVNINLSFLFFRYNQFETNIAQLNGRVKIALFFLFNVTTITLWNSIKINAFTPEVIKELRVLNINVERNSIEYFFSFLIGYTVLTFLVKVICTDMLGENVSDYKVYKAVLCSSATFWTLMVYESFIFAIIHGVTTNSLYSLSDFKKQISVLIFVILIVFKYLYWIFGVYFSVSYRSMIKKTLITFIVLLVFALTEIFKLAYADWVVSADVRVAQEDVYLVSVAQERYLRFKDDKDSILQKGYCIADLNRYTRIIKDSSIFSAAMRLKYKMIYIITIAIKESPYDKEMPKMLGAIIKNNYEYTYNEVMKMHDIFSKEHYDYIAPHEAEKALIEIKALPKLKDLYEKELRHEMDYDIASVLYTDYRVATEYIPNAGNRKKTLFFVNRFIRYVP